MPKTQLTDEELDAAVDALDVLKGKMRDPHKIINGRADPLDDKDASITYALAQSLLHVLGQRVKALGIPDTFQKAIDVWEFEVDHTAKFMLENFHLELNVLFVRQFATTHNIDLLAIKQPNVEKLRGQLAQFITH